MKKQTRLLLAGRSPEDNHGIVNPPVYHASTITYPTVAELEEADRTPYDGVRYGRCGTITAFALEEAICELEGGYRSIAVCSGMAAITASLTAFLKSGDRVLMSDTVYGPTRKFCESNLKRYGIETQYYDPMIAGRIAELIDERTRVVFMESPGSLTFEVQDVPAIAAAAKDKGAITIIDNTWSAGFYFQPLEHGVDVSIQSVTKYIGGHSDLMMGTITCNEGSFLTVKRECSVIGLHAAPDDCYLALRGIRTLAARLDRHQDSALRIAEWLQDRSEVVRVLHPALPSCPGHDIWKRDFSGSSGLFSIVLDERYDKASVAAMLDGMELFPLGYSWGGYESLIVPADPRPSRTVTDWSGGQLLRLHVGLEDPGDLIADLQKGFARLNN